MPKAKAAAQKALQLDDGLAEAHASLAYISMVYDWNWTSAEKEFKRAIELNPNYAGAHEWYADFLAARGREAEALSEMKRARDAGIVIVPAMAFYSGLGDLLATAATSDWPDADEISIAYGLSSWQPTTGTRLITTTPSSARRNPSTMKHCGTR